MVFRFYVNLPGCIKKTWSPRTQDAQVCFSGSLIPLDIFGPLPTGWVWVCGNSGRCDDQQSAWSAQLYFTKQYKTYTLKQKRTANIKQANMDPDTHPLEGFFCPLPTDGVYSGSMGSSPAGGSRISNLFSLQSFRPASPRRGEKTTPTPRHAPCIPYLPRNEGWLTGGRRGIGLRRRIARRIGPRPTEVCICDKPESSMSWCVDGWILATTSWTVEGLFGSHDLGRPIRGEERGRKGKTVYHTR